MFSSERVFISLIFENCRQASALFYQYTVLAWIEQAAGPNFPHASIRDVKEGTLLGEPEWNS